MGDHFYLRGKGLSPFHLSIRPVLLGCDEAVVRNRGCRVVGDRVDIT